MGRTFPVKGRQQSRRRFLLFWVRRGGTQGPGLAGKTPHGRGAIASAHSATTARIEGILCRSHRRSIRMAKRRGEFWREILNQATRIWREFRGPSTPVEAPAAPSAMVRASRRRQLACARPAASLVGAGASNAAWWTTQSGKRVLAEGNKDSLVPEANKRQKKVREGEISQLRSIEG